MIDSIALLDTFYYEYDDNEIHIFKILAMTNNDIGGYKECLILFDDGSSGRFEITYSPKYGFLFDGYFKIKRIFL